MSLCRWSQGWCPRKRLIRRFLTCVSLTTSPSENFAYTSKITKITSLIFRLIWKDAPPKPVKEEAEMANGVNNVNLGETKKEEGVKTETKEKSNGVENGNASAPPRAPSPVLHSYS